MPRRSWTTEMSPSLNSTAALQVLLALPVELAFRVQVALQERPAETPVHLDHQGLLARKVQRVRLGHQGQGIQVPSARLVRMPPRPAHPVRLALLAEQPLDLLGRQGHQAPTARKVCLVLRGLPAHLAPTLKAVLEALARPDSLA